MDAIKVVVASAVVVAVLSGVFKVDSHAFQAMGQDVRVVNVGTVFSPNKLATVAYTKADGWRITFQGGRQFAFGR